MDIFNLDEADFLALYAGVVGGGLLLALVLRFALRRPGGTPAEMPALHRYEIALLAGGPAHAVNAAVTSLLKRGMVTLGESTGRLFREAALPADAHPLERRIHDLPPGTRIDVVPDLVTGETQPLEGRLQELGLTLTGAQAARARWAPVVLLGGVTLFGLVKVLIELASHRQPTSLTVACAVPVAGAVLAYMKEPRLSRRGDRVLARLRAEHAALDETARKGPEGLPTDDLTLAIGLFGVGVLTTGPLAKVRRVLRGTPDTTSDGVRSCGSGFPQEDAGDDKVTR